MNRNNFKAWDSYNKVFKEYSLKELAEEDKFNYDVEYEAIQSGFDNWIWLKSTQRKDINGQEIFSGHIVIDMYTRIFSVYYSEHFMRWQLLPIHKESELYNSGLGVPMFDFMNPVCLKIIGDIFQNFEFLSIEKKDNKDKIND